MIYRTLILLLVGVVSALGQPPESAAAPLLDLETAIAAIDALPPHNELEYRIEGYPEAEDLRNAIIDKWKQGDATGLAEVIRLKPTSTHSWQVIIKTFWSPAGVSPEVESLAALKLVFVSSITPGDNWLSEETPVPKGMTTFQFRDHIAERLVKKVFKVEELPDQQLLRANPVAWYEKTFSEKVSPSLLRGNQTAGATNHGSNSVSSEHPKVEKSVASPVRGAVPQPTATSVLWWAGLGIGGILIVGLVAFFILRSRKR